MLGEQRNSFSSKIKSFVSKPKNIFIAAVVVLLLIAATFFINSSQTLNQKPVTINKQYSITARTSDRRGTDGTLKLRVTDAQFADSIIVQGKTARPVKGKIFLIINMEIENPYRVVLYTFPVDLFRLIRSDGEKFAPSVHQGSVEIRPQATKKSNVAFVVLPGDKKFKLEVGEVSGTKQTLIINF
jgi:hypothetical protein